MSLAGLAHLGRSCCAAVPLPVLGAALTLLACGLSVAGDLAPKSSARIDRAFCAGVVLYALAAVPVALSYKVLSYGAVALLWQALVVGVSIGLATYRFHEPLTPWRYGALAATFCAILLAGIAERA